MAEDKIYCGSGKKSQYGTNLDLCLSKIPKEHITEDKNGNKYIKLKVDERKNPDDYGNTHYITVNTWKPSEEDKAKWKAQNEVKENIEVGEDQGDDLPF